MNKTCPSPFCRFEGAISGQEITGNSSGLTCADKCKTPHQTGCDVNEQSQSLKCCIPKSSAGIILEHKEHFFCINGQTIKSCKVSESKSCRTVVEHDRGKLENWKSECSKIEKDQVCEQMGGRKYDKGSYKGDYVCWSSGERGKLSNVGVKELIKRPLRCITVKTTLKEANNTGSSKLKSTNCTIAAENACELIYDWKATSAEDRALTYGCSNTSCVAKNQFCHVHGKKIRCCCSTND